MAIKFDMSKAYDQVEWGFLSNVMLKLDFRQHWVDLIVRSVQLAPFFFSSMARLEVTLFLGHICVMVVLYLPSYSYFALKAYLGYLEGG